MSQKSVPLETDSMNGVKTSHMQLWNSFEPVPTPWLPKWHWQEMKFIWETEMAQNVQHASQNSEFQETKLSSNHIHFKVNFWGTISGVLPNKCELTNENKNVHNLPSLCMD